MSHIVTIKTEVRDREAVAMACRRLGLEAPVEGTAQLFSGPCSGLIVLLPGWQYPVACELESGKLHYDNYGGQWGDREQLDRFLQAYAVEKARIEARKQGHDVLEQELPNGSIKLSIELGGAA